MKKFYLILAGVILFNFINVVSVSALSVAVHIPENTDVQAGGRFYFEIDVKYPENPQRKDLRLEYKILTFDGELIAQAKVLKAVETQISFMDFVTIPESAKKGFYIINVEIRDYEDLSEEVEASFQVTNKGEQIKIYFFVLLGMIILIGLLVIIVLFRKKKR